MEITRIKWSEAERKRFRIAVSFYSKHARCSKEEAAALIAPGVDRAVMERRRDRNGVRNEVARAAGYKSRV